MYRYMHGEGAQPTEARREGAGRTLLLGRVFSFFWLLEQSRHTHATQMLPSTCVPALLTEPLSMTSPGLINTHFLT